MSKLTIRAIRYGRMVVRLNYRKALLIKSTRYNSILSMMYSFDYSQINQLKDRPTLMLVVKKLRYMKITK